MFENSKLKFVKPYKLSSQEVWKYKYDDNILKLDWNEATIIPSPMVLKSIYNELKKGKLNWYPDTNNSELIQLLAKYNKVKKSNIQYFASSDTLHEYIVRCFTETGDLILVIGPTYDNFRAVAESSGGIVKYIYLNKDFTLNFDKLNECISKLNPKVVYLVNPNNPTGTLHPVDMLINSISKFKNSLFIIDEAYFEFSGLTLSNEVSKHENILISRTFSKAFALASFRIGYAISNTKNIQSLNKIRNPKNISHFAQIAAISALKDIGYTYEYVNEVKKAKSTLNNFLKKIKSIDVFSGHGNFLFIRFYNLNKKKEFINFLNSKKIYIRDYGHIKKTENFVRITIGTTKQMKKVIETLKLFFKI